MMLRRHRRGFARRLRAVLLALAALTWVRAARAGDPALARSLFDAGMAALKAGQVSAEVCAKLEESNRLDPALGTRFYHAECLEKLGRTASAWAAYLDVAESARIQKLSDHEKYARERAAALTGRLTRLIVIVPADVRAVPGLRILRNGELIGEPTFGTPLPVDPGKHQISVTAPGRRTWSSEVEAMGQGSTVTVTVPSLQAEPEVKPVVGPAATVAPPSAGEDPAWPVSKKLGLGVAVTGGVSLVAGAIFGGLAASTWSSSQAECLPDDRTRCSAKGVALGNEVRAFGTASTVMIAAGGVLAAGGVTLFVLAPGAPERTRPARSGPKPSLTVRAGLASVAVRGDW